MRHLDAVDALPRGRERSVWHAGTGSPRGVAIRRTVGGLRSELRVPARSRMPVAHWNVPALATRAIPSAPTMCYASAVSAALGLRLN